MKAKNSSATTDVISCSTNSSSSGCDSDVDMSFLNNGELVFNKKRNSNEFENGYLFAKKQKTVSFESGVVSPPEFSNGILAPLPLNFVPLEAEPISSFPPVGNDDASKKSEEAEPVLRACKQFWKAGDYEGGNAGDSLSNSGDLFYYFPVMFMRIINACTKLRVLFFFLRMLLTPTQYFRQ